MPVDVGEWRRRGLGLGLGLEPFVYFGSEGVRDTRVLGGLKGGYISLILSWEVRCVRWGYLDFSFWALVLGWVKARIPFTQQTFQ